MDIARDVSSRGTCTRPGRMVGAVIVHGRKIISTGYNGAPKGAPHCEEVGCLRERMKVPSGERAELCRGIHAEQNAILQAAEHGVSIKGGTMYVTHSPCAICMKMIINSGVTLVVFANEYPDGLAPRIAQESNWLWETNKQGGAVGTTERVMEWKAK